MALVAAAVFVLAATCAQAQLAQFPYDVTVFPDRDFVSCTVSQGRLEGTGGLSLCLQHAL
jgi:hypothetical protein